LRKYRAVLGPGETGNIVGETSFMKIVSPVDKLGGICFARNIVSMM